MAQAQFPEPKDVIPSNTYGDGQAPKTFGQYTLDNPHPGFGKDPNILNEYGHTKFPMWVKNTAGESVIVNNEMEKSQVEGDTVKEPSKQATGWS
jgi:hypothetical protein